MVRIRFAILATIWLVLVMQAAWVSPNASGQTEKKYHDSVSQKNMNDRRNKRKLRHRNTDSLNSYLKDTVNERKKKHK